MEKLRGNGMQQLNKDLQALSPSNDEVELFLSTVDRLLAFEHDLQKLRWNEEQTRLLNDLVPMVDTHLDTGSIYI